ncbi:TIR domain-containing protein [Aeromonas caviae]
MAFAFLSHSSNDKEFVSVVYNELGSRYAIYDQASFDNYGDLVSEIRQGLNDCSVFVLFLSSYTLSSGWVNAEIDLAEELKAKNKIKSVLVFLLDDVDFNLVPDAFKRYKISSVNSPRYVASRIKSELHNENKNFLCFGRDDLVRNINSNIFNELTCIFLSGATGIGRRTVAKKVFMDSYRKGDRAYEININNYEGITSLYKGLLPYTSSWRLKDYIHKTKEFNSYPLNQQVDIVTENIVSICRVLKEPLTINLQLEGVEENGHLSAWVNSLIDSLPVSDFPLVIFISNKPFFKGHNNCLFVNIEPLSESDSKYMFNMLLRNMQVNLPQNLKPEHIISHMIGHPGIIELVVNYLRRNSDYRANRLHTNVVSQINAEVERILIDYKGNKNKEDQRLVDIALAIFSEAGQISSDEIKLIDTHARGFEDTLYELLDVGFVLFSDGFYCLPQYLEKYAQRLVEHHSDIICVVRKAIFANINELTDDDYFPEKLLDARIIQSLKNDEALPGLISQAIMPSQQLRAARKLYNEEKYSKSYKLSCDAMEQSSKLSSIGKYEAWRLIGLSASRLQLDEGITLFNESKSQIEPSKSKNMTLHFVNGFYHRANGNLRLASTEFNNAIKFDPRDVHCLREIAFIQAFDEQFQLAAETISRALNISNNNPYLIDLACWIKIKQLKAFPGAVQITDIETLIEKLFEADAREGTQFAYKRNQMYKILIKNDIEALSEYFSKRNELRTDSKLVLLDLLYEKNKSNDFVVLLNELKRSIADSKNRIAELEFLKCNILYLTNSSPSEARTLLERHKNKFTEHMENRLRRDINAAEAYAKRQ